MEEGRKSHGAKERVGLEDGRSIFDYLPWVIQNYWGKNKNGTEAAFGVPGSSKSL